MNETQADAAFNDAAVSEAARTADAPGLPSGQSAPSTPPSATIKPEIDVLTAAKTARALLSELTDQTIDAVSKVERGAEGWTVEIDVLESRARIGDDDLLTAYAIELSADGAFLSYRRLRRRRRFDDPSDEAA